MNLTVLLPSKIFLNKADVLRLVVDTQQGSLGLLPQRLDCVAILVPGLLMYEAAAGTRYLAVDAGVLIKTGADVRVSVRRALEGNDLSRLREKIDNEYRALDETKRSVRAVNDKLEMGFLRRLGAIHRD